MHPAISRLRGRMDLNKSPPYNPGFDSFLSAKLGRGSKHLSSYFPTAQTGLCLSVAAAESRFLTTLEFFFSDVRDETDDQVPP